MLRIIDFWCVLVKIWSCSYSCLTSAEASWSEYYSLQIFLSKKQSGVVLGKPANGIYEYIIYVTRYAYHVCGMHTECIALHNLRSPAFKRFLLCQ